MWVCLRSVKRVVNKGQVITYYPGEWVNVTRHLAREWLEAGDAYEFQPGEAEPTAGVVLRGATPATLETALVNSLGVTIRHERQPCLPFAETLLLALETVRMDVIPVGFRLLTRWQVVVPLWDYQTLAAHVGEAAERERTQVVIRDLRVPLRDTRMIFVRRCQQTRDLLDCWNAELQDGGDERLAFLRALYQVKPLVCDVPASWTGNVS